MLCFYRKLWVIELLFLDLEVLWWNCRLFPWMNQIEILYTIQFHQSSVSHDNITLLKGVIKDKNIICVFKGEREGALYVRTKQYCSLFYSAWRWQSKVLQFKTLRALVSHTIVLSHPRVWLLYIITSTLKWRKLLWNY